MNNGPISFPNWKQTLAENGLDPDQRASFEREIISFLRHCKITHSPVTVSLIRQWLAVKEPQIQRVGPPSLAAMTRQASNDPAEKGRMRGTATSAGPAKDERSYYFTAAGKALD